MPLRSEKEMYPLVVLWFQSTIQQRHKRSKVTVYDTSRTALSRFLERIGLSDVFPDCATYEIRVDVTAIIQSPKSARLAFVECKLSPIALRDIAQLLGYSVVAEPLYSIIVSPSGITSAVQQLLTVYQRFDILEYARGRRITVATWNQERGEVLASSVLPPGAHIS